MSRKSRNRHKPYNPAASAMPAELSADALRRRASRAEAQRIKAIGGAVNYDDRRGELTGAWRMNCFNTLLVNPSPERSAVDWLEELVMTANGENGKELRLDHIRSSTEGAPGQNVSDAMIYASRVLAEVERLMRPQQVRMLFALLQPISDPSPIHWRDIVKAATGETDDRAQGAVVREACRALAWIREEAPNRAVETRRKAA